MSVAAFIIGLIAGLLIGSLVTAYIGSKWLIRNLPPQDELTVAMKAIDDMERREILRRARLIS